MTQRSLACVRSPPNLPQRSPSFRSHHHSHAKPRTRSVPPRPPAKQTDAELVRLLLHACSPPASPSAHLSPNNTRGGGRDAGEEEEKEEEHEDDDKQEDERGSAPTHSNKRRRGRLDSLGAFLYLWHPRPACALPHAHARPGRTFIHPPIPPP
jgi:hypothetical protein